MKLICDRLSLLEATAKVQGATQNSSIPALEGIYFSASAGYLTMTGYNLEMGITTAVESQIDQDGSIILSARYFSEIIKKLPSSTVSIETDDKYVCTIKSGETRFSIIGMPPEEYPDLPSVSDGRSFTFSGKILSNMIRQTKFSVSKKDDKPVYTGILFEIKDGIINLVAVDGFRMAIRTEKINTEEEFKFIVPEKTLSEIQKLIGEDDKEIRISVERRHIIFEIDQYLVVSRLLEGDFIDWKHTVPADYNTTVISDTKDLLSCVDRVSLVVNDRDRVFVRCKIRNNSFEASCESTVGNADDKVLVDIKGDEVEIGFNSRYLIDALRAVEDDKIKLQLNGPQSPVKIVPCDGNDFLFLVLPVRISK